jgi:hypothetical protein
MRKIITKRLSSLYIYVPALRPGTVGAYALAVVSVGVATALRVALDPFVVGVQFITFFPAVVITAVISGFGAGLLAAVLGTASEGVAIGSPAAMVESSVDGAVDLEYAPSGVTWRLTCPAAKALERGGSKAA